MPALTDFTFDTSTLTSAATDSPEMLAWSSDQGAWIDLALDPAPPPDLFDPAFLQRCREENARRGLELEVGLIEMDMCEVAGHPALQTIAKTKGPVHGLRYIGMLEPLFRDFRFTIRVICDDGGWSSVRYAVLADRFLRAGRIRISEAGQDRAKAGGAENVMLGPQDIDGWTVKWLETVQPAHLCRNIVEDAIYDVEFPNDPLSRTRRFLDLVRTTARLAPSVAGEATYQ